jgi:dihydroorotase
MVVLKRAHLICPITGLNSIGTIWVEGGKLTRISTTPDTDLSNYEGYDVIDCEGKFVFPGLIDVMTFCGELGLQHREDFSSLSMAALAGGFTNVVVGPWGHPCTDTPAVVTDLRARSISYPVQYHFLGSLTKLMEGEQLAELGLMKNAGAIGFTDGGTPIRNSSVLRRALQYAQRLDLPIFLTPVDPDLDKEGVMHEGIVSTRIGLRGIPEASEIIGASRLAALAEDTGAKVCIGPLSSAKSLNYITSSENIQVRLASRSMILSDSAVETSAYNPSTHLRPPLRSGPKDLIAAVMEDKINIIGADHHPLTRVEKDMEFALSTPGAMGLETALSVAYSTIQDMYLVIEKMMKRPALLCGLSKGLQIGSDVDIVIFDPNISWIPTTPFRSKGINEPLEGLPLQGKVVVTMVGEKYFSFKA